MNADLVVVLLLQLQLAVDLGCEIEHLRKGAALSNQHIIILPKNLQQIRAPSSVLNPLNFKTNRIRILGSISLRYGSGFGRKKSKCP